VLTCMIAGALLVHTPPAAPPDATIWRFGSVIVFSIVEPVGASAPGVGNGLTVTCATRLHVFVHVYVMFDVPPDTPVTIPLDEPTVAFAPWLLNQVPPASVLDSVVVAPWHTVSVPVIAAGNGFTVTIAVLIQPPLPVYVMLVVPAVTPVTTPEVTPIVATDGVALVHEIPPGRMLYTTFVLPIHTGTLPLIAAAPPLTVIGFVLQHVGFVEYVIVGVPADTPVMIPVPAPTVAKPVLLLVHAPPRVVLLNVTVLPTHTFVVPVITGRAALTVAIAVARQPATVYDILDVPADIPVITPVAPPIAATPVVPEVHTPPGVVLDSVDVEVAHKVSVPVIGSGPVVTVTTAVRAQPDECV